MKTLRRPLALLMALVMVLGLLTVGVAADSGYTTPAVEGKNDPNSAVYLEQKSYDPATGILTMSLSGKLSADLGIAGATGWNLVSFMLSFDNTKMAILDAGDRERGGSTANDSTVPVKAGKAPEPVLEYGEDYGDGIEYAGEYTVQDNNFFKKGDRTAFYMSITGSGAEPYGQTPGSKYEIIELRFQVAEIDGAYPTDLSKVFTKDTLRFATWAKDEAVMEGVYDTAANDGYAALFMVMGGGNDVRRMYSPMEGADTTGFDAASSEHKLMQATVVYDGVDNVTPGSLSGDMVADAVAYNKIGAVEIPVTAPTLLDTDGDPISGGNYNITYTVSDNGGENFADVTYANGKITVPADFVKAYVAADTPVVITVTAQLDGYDSIKLTDTVTVNVAASEVDTLEGPTTVVRGQSAGQKFEYTYTAKDQYGISVTNKAWTLKESVAGVTVDETGKVTVSDSAAANSKFTLCIDGKEHGPITVTDLSLKEVPTVTKNTFVYGEAVTVTLNSVSAILVGDKDYSATVMTAAVVGEAKNVGKYDVLVTYDTTAPGGVYTYTIEDAIEITKKPLTVSASPVEKFYDGNKNATVELELNGVVGNDDVSIASGYTAAFDSKDVDATKVTVSGIALEGTAIGNYEFTTTTLEVNGSIKQVTITPELTVPNKVYDGTTDVKNYSVSFTGLVGSEVLAENTDYTVSGLKFSSKEVGEVTVSGTIELKNTAVANNYVLETTALSAESKIVNLYLANQPSVNAGPFAYGETKYSDLITLPSMSKLIVGVDAVDAVKYEITAYVGGESKTVAPTDLVEVAVDKVVVTFYDASNNAVESKPLTGFTVAPKALTVSASGIVSKVYDGNVTAAKDAISLTLDGKIGTDEVNADFTGAAYDSANVGTGKTVTVSGITVDNTNYTVDTTCTLTGTVTARELTVSAVAGKEITKVYDGTPNVSAEKITADLFALGNVVPGDEVAVDVSGASGEYNSKDVDTANTVTVSGLTLSNANYKLADGAKVDVPGEITTAPVTISAADSYDKITKEYDGDKYYNDTEGLVGKALKVSGLKGSDTLELGIGYSVVEYEDANVGVDKKVTVSMLSFHTNEKLAKNYTITNESVELKGDITPKVLTGVQVEVADKVYDGTTDVPAGNINVKFPAGNGPVPSASDYTATGTFASSEIGEHRVEVEVELTSANFAFKNGSELIKTAKCETEASIVDLQLNTQPSLKDTEFTYGDYTYGDLINMPSTTDLIVGAGGATSDAESKITVSINDGEEVVDFDTIKGQRVPVSTKSIVVTFYSGSSPVNSNKLELTVSPKRVDLNTINLTKVYDGTTAYTGDGITIEESSILSGDEVTLDSWVATYDSANVGTGIGIDISNVVFGGDDADNYESDGSKTTGSITAKELTVTYTGADLTKVYDGTKDYETAITAFKLDGFVGTDSANVSYAKAEFNSQDVASASKVTVSGLALDNANYELNVDSLDIPATITPAPITATLTVANKVWDGTDKAFEYDVSFEGFVNGETTTDYTASNVKFNGTDAGSEAVGTVTLADGSNYELTGTTVKGEITKNTSAEVSFATKTAADGTVTFVVKVTVEDEEGNTVVVSAPDWTASDVTPEPGDEITVTVTGNDNYAGATSEGLIYYGGLAVFFLCSDEDLADINDAATVFDIENVKSALASALVDESGNDAHVKVAAQVLGVEKDDDGVIESVNLVVFTTRVVDSTGAQHITELDDELIIKLNVPASVDKAYAKVEVAGSSEYIELDEGEDVLTLTIEDTKMSSPYAIEFTDDDGSSDDAIVGPAVLVYTTAKPGGVVNPQMKYVAKGGSTYITIAPNPGNTIDTIKINGVVVNYKDMLVGPNEAGLYHLRLTNLNRDAYIEVSFKLKSQIVWQNPFTDVKPTDWFYSSVEFASIHGLFNGTSATTFSPEEPMTRAMLVTVLHRLEGGPVMYSKASFKDVPVGKYYTDAVAWASNVGIVTGYTDGTFDPDGLVTREQMAAILWRYAKYKGYDVSVGENTNILSYDDAFSVSEYAIPAMQWACGSGIINGVTPSTLQPKANATRAVVATILMRFCNYYLV